MTDRKNHWGRRRGEPGPGTDVPNANEPALPGALVDEHARIVRSRSAARRVLARGRTRRRVVPPLVAGSGALLGSTMIGAWVFGQAPSTAATTAPGAATPTTTAPNPDEAQLNLDVAALTRVRQALAADNAAISGLTASAGGGVSPGQAGGSGTGGAGTSAAGAGGAGAPARPSSPLPPIPALPGAAPAAPLGPLPTIPTVTMPAAAPPPTHTTTGATVVVP